jgi:putative selenium metabolism protein SsnA
MRLGLTGATVVTSLDPPATVDAGVLVDDERIVAVGDVPDGTPLRDCSGCVILPGNVCAHTHLYSALARGMPYRLEPPANFLQILQRIWWRLDRALDDESVRASALVGGMEALLSGTTTIVDHHASPSAIDGSLDIIADALEELGVRSVLCYEATDRDGPERARAGVEENRRFLRTMRALSRGMVGAHASFTLSEDTLSACVEVARDAGVGIHVHVAEDLADQADAEARFGRSVLERLAGAEALTSGALLAHCVHVRPAEIDLIERSGGTVAHNPRSNMNNAVGRAPVQRLENRVALGTDGIGADMFAESQAAYWRAREENVFVSGSWALARLAEGARFAGRAFGEPALGRIAPGAPADLIVLDYGPPAPLSSESLAGHWLFGVSARGVRDVMVGGRLVVTEGRLAGVDQDKIVAEAEGAAQRLFTRLDDVGPHPFQPEGGR